jgi:16S rRNA (cytosine1402-N4)-methyltransferase
MGDSSSATFHPFERPAGIGTSPVEGLQMRSEFHHVPVMLGEVVSLFAPVPAGVVVDATSGGGGHSAALLQAYPRMRVLALDRDPAAVDATAERLRRYGERAVVVHASFGELAEVASGCGIGPGTLSGALFDLGVSSTQLDVAERGFSYRVSGPLDMRMDPSVTLTAAELLERMSEPELARILAENGEGRLARRLARAILAARPIRTTGELADVVGRSVPAPGRRRGHPAKRVFQALRIAVNAELDQLESAIPAAIGMLAPGGRCVVIAYHSGEDRTVKRALASAESGGCTCPAGLPCVCGAVSLGRLVSRGARRPSPAEVMANRRAEQARLRAFERAAQAGAPSLPGDLG